jgi:hypothetical protein
MKHRKHYDDSFKGVDSDYIHYVYKIINKENGMFYIGIRSIPKLKNISPEEDNYWGSGIQICKAIKTLGKDSFNKEILFIFDTREEARLKEKELVTLDLVSSTKCYNLVEGGGENYLGKVSVVLKSSNKRILVPIEEFYENRNLYRSYREDTVCARLKDSNEDFKLISLDEYVNNKEMYETPASGKVRVYKIKDDKIDSSKIRVITLKEYRENPSKYILVSLINNPLKGKVIAKKSDGTSSEVVVLDKTDPRILSGEFVGIMKGVKKSKDFSKKISGDKNGSYGAIWITNGTESIKFRGDRIPDGWRKGRTVPKERRHKLSISYRDIALKRMLESNIISEKDINKEEHIISFEKLYNLYKSCDFSKKKLLKLLRISSRFLYTMINYYKSQGLNIDQ